MRTGIALTLLLLCAYALHAQEGQGDQGTNDAPPPEPVQAEPAGNSPPPEGAEEHSGPPPRMSLDDARVNVFTLIQSFMAERSTDGIWYLKSKTNGGVKKLSLVSTEISNLREVGGGKFRGVVQLKDVKTLKYYDAQFTTDIGGKEWKVLGMNLTPGKAPKPKKKLKASKKKAAKTDEDEAAEGDPAPPSDDGGGSAP